MFRGIGRVLSNRSFRLYTLGAAASVHGYWLQRMGVAWLTWELTHSATWLGIIAMADAVPSTILLPITGVIADRGERLKLLRWTQLGQTSLASGLTVAALTNWLTIELVLAFVVAIGAVQSFAQPARHALYPSLVETNEVSAAVAFNSSIFNLARFVGPAVAGVLITTFGVAASFGVAALAFGSFLWILFDIRPLRTEPLDTGRPDVLAQAVAGIRYAFSNPAVGPILALIVAATVTGRSYYELLPAFSDRVFGLGAEGLASLLAAVGVGALISSVWLSSRDRTHGMTRIAVHLILLVAISQAVFAWTQDFVLGLFCMLLTGFGTVGTSICCQAMLLDRVDSRLRGRIMSIYGVVFRNAPALGAVALGALSERRGLSFAMMISAFGCAVVWGWAALRRSHWQLAVESTSEFRVG